MRRRRILFTGIVARMEDTRLPKCVILGELVGSRAALGGRKKSGWGVSWTILEISVSTPTSKRLQPRKRGDGARRRNKGRNVSWRNGSPLISCKWRGLESSGVFWFADAMLPFSGVTFVFVLFRFRL